MKMTLSQALKEKNRIAHQLQQAMQLIREENSKDASLKRIVNVRKKLEETKGLVADLVRYKSAIAYGNGGILNEMAELSETKSLICGLRTIDTTIVNNYNSVLNIIRIRTVLTKADVLNEIDALQKRADELQDKIDAYNARNEIEV